MDKTRLTCQRIIIFFFLFKKSCHNCHYVCTFKEYLYDSVIYPIGGEHIYSWLYEFEP